MTVAEMTNMMLHDEIVMVRRLREDNIMETLYFGRKENLDDESINQFVVKFLASCECTVTNTTTGVSEKDTTILLYV